ncbi:MAG: DNA repair protein RecN [Bacteroidales bacterium]|nr:DNA repair protein RecN [Bacteroidales bacterium]
MIDSLEINFPEGLIIITGQTGAGKSILLGALSLIMGAKGDASSIADGAETCVVEAEFMMPGDGEEIKEILSENEVEDNGDGSVLIRRVIYRTGRTRAFVNDSPVNQQVLSSLASKLIDIHSQHQTLLLSDKQFQMSMLDHFAGNAALLKDCGEAYIALQDDLRQLEEVTEKLDKAKAEKDYNEAQLEQLEKANLRDGELEELDAEQKQLANAEEIKENLSAVEQLFSPQDGEMPSISVSLKEAEKILSRVSKFVPSLQDLSERVSSVRLELDDIEAEVSSVNSSTELSEERLMQVEDRMTLLYDLFKKHGCSTVAELIALKDKYSEAVFNSDALESKKAQLENKVSEDKKKLSAICSLLTKARKDASKPFADSIRDSVRSLELDRAVFEVQIEPAPQSKTGSDTVRFMFSSTGVNPVDIAKCASGGELSRIMLCLKAMMAKYTAMPTLIFDEIDTGVSGSVADKMGSMICSMGADMQVFAITHLAQVAAKGTAHYLVSKGVSEESGKVTSTIKRLSPEERVLEIARILSGSEITEAAISNAKSLISKA